ncbi:translesion error-prone DNA polymerase V autoproteolytic subunit [Endozoicomonas sp. SM1973]|uniref:Translesion error-prone DNA polymerase V autoproteolytic subunit n=1 Tax=Spartinivicinus marinus TaxID=2994442 RepID=A0A853IHN6_9GAMM|nr:translesion error-prone DNA polymerase V autoproteolytic subunit [Spartinivicinus marinus]MCX4030344.1 translesion error-prone DNA polymerase V autoproteolytic subunit [Spartinivicinus marinus]NYZ69544.1 translesion error-prone DNA polymerase V autoproteolytic subunit [Spartinivicinus marinus]
MQVIQRYTAKQHSSQVAVPLLSSHVAAGFPSPADDYVEADLNLHDFAVKHPAATFFVRATGESMVEVGIQSGDILVVDRALTPQNGDIVIAALEGELTVKQLRLSKNKAWLIPRNPQFKPIEITEHFDCVIWGVVAHSLHSFR